MPAKTLTPKQIAHMLDMLQVIEQIGESVRKHAIELVHAGTTIPGYEAAFTSSRRGWSDEDAAAATLATLGLKGKARYVTELLSPAQAEKVLKAKKLWPKKPRGSAAEDFVDPFTAADVLSYSDSKPTIRKASASQST